MGRREAGSKWFELERHADIIDPKRLVPVRVRILAAGFVGIGGRFLNRDRFLVDAWALVRAGFDARHSDLGANISSRLHGRVA